MTNPIYTQWDDMYILTFLTNLSLIEWVKGAGNFFHCRNQVKPTYLPRFRTVKFLAVTFVIYLKAHLLIHESFLTCFLCFSKWIRNQSCIFINERLFSKMERSVMSHDFLHLGKINNNLPVFLEIIVPNLCEIIWTYIWSITWLLEMFIDYYLKVKL